MRRLEKLEIPEVLDQKAAVWLEDYKADAKNKTKKFRYRNSEIKERLRKETCDKCIYCESKVGHNTPGDVEHLVPSSVDIDLHFRWENLTLACTECNRRKSNYFVKGTEFLNPYVDDVENLIEHHGPVAFWSRGNERAEVTIKKLELNSGARTQLVTRKLEKLNDVSNLYERYHSADGALKDVLRQALEEMTQACGEFSGMVATFLQAKDKRPLFDWVNGMLSSSDASVTDGG